MDKKKPIIMLSIAVVIALVITLLTYMWLKRQISTAEKSMETQPVVVAAVDVSWGTNLTKEMIKTAPFLKSSLPPGCFSDPAEVVGRTLIYPARSGELVLESRLAPVNVKTGGVAAMITPNKRAMAVKVDKVIGVAGFVHPGNRVDVLVTLAETDKRQNPITKIVLENDFRDGILSFIRFRKGHKHVDPVAGVNKTGNADHLVDFDGHGPLIRRDHRRHTSRFHIHRGQPRLQHKFPGPGGIDECPPHDLRGVGEAPGRQAAFQKRSRLDHLLCQICAPGNVDGGHDDRLRFHRLLGRADLPLEPHVGQQSDHEGNHDCDAEHDDRFLLIHGVSPLCEYGCFCCLFYLSVRCRPLHPLPKKTPFGFTETAGERNITFPPRSQPRNRERAFSHPAAPERYNKFFLSKYTS